MARVLGLFGQALTAAREGLSQNAFERRVQSLGIGARASEQRQLFQVAKKIVAGSPDEIFQPLEQVPTPGQNDKWVVKNGSGIAQTVTLTYRDKATGQIKQTWWRTVTPSGMTREQAIATAIDKYSDTADRYGQDLIGAVHTSAYELVQEDAL